MFNHMGHFAAAGEVFYKSLLLGGVTRRFLDLRVALLEGGVANACRLYADVIARWEKRGAPNLPQLDPANLDRDLFEEWGDDRTRSKFDVLEYELGLRDVEDGIKDNFDAMGIERAEDFYDRFVPHFYFGYEADDPVTAWAFNDRINPFGAKIRAIMSTDLGHWDVSDMREAVAEAYEPVEAGTISPDDFRDFAFTNQVTLYGSTNSEFFDATLVADTAAEVLAS